jgi:protein-S-isoprenylcysteine O-methyltransferase Ste14
MPVVALALCALWFVTLFVVRTVVQWAQTGSTGVKGFHGPVGSPSWLAGMSASLGLVLAPLAPLAAIYHWSGGALLIESSPLHLVGAALVLVGIAGGLYAQFSMGDSWRVGVDEAERTELVTGGPFAWVRNPIFSCVWLSALGLLLLVPNVLALAACLLTIVGIELQVRVVEEPYLRETHAEAYDRYAARVGRFVPGLGRR